MLPQRYRINKRLLTAQGRNYQPGGVSSAWSIGESDEFLSLRDYRDGDPLRKIHWPSTAKRQKPIVREFQDEYFVRHGLILDTACQDAAVLETAVSVAASYLTAMNDSDSMIDLIYVAQSDDAPGNANQKLATQPQSSHQQVAGLKTEIVTAGRGTQSTNSQLEALATLTATSHSEDMLCQGALSHAQRISGCVVVFSAWNESRKKLLSTLQSRQIPCLTLLVTAEPEHSDLPPGVTMISTANPQQDLERV